MITLLKRHEIQVLLKAGHTQAQTARITKLSARSVRRVAKEPEVANVDDGAEREQRKIGRPSAVEPFRSLVERLLGEQVDILSVEILRRARLDGYTGGKSALYQLVAALRPPAQQRMMMRFEGLPGEFSQHDFGQVRVRFANGDIRVVHFFASRLKWSRWVVVTLVDNEVVETLVRELAEHFCRFGGVSLCAVFDRPTTVALSWSKDGEVREWNPTFAYAALELGFTAEVCWPHAPNQKGAVENLVGWVKGSFFKQRRFHDIADLKEQLLAWLQEVNTQRPSRATGQIPALRMEQEQERLRPIRYTAEELAQNRLAVAVAIRVRRVEEVDPGIERRTHGAEDLALRLLTPEARTELPRAVTDRTDLQPRRAECHSCCHGMESFFCLPDGATDPADEMRT